MSDSESIAPRVIITSSFLITLASVGLVLRLYSRIKITRSFGADDAVLALAWALHIVDAGFVYARK